MNIEEWLIDNEARANAFSAKEKVVSLDQLREFMKGKIVLPFDVAESAQSEIAMEVVECERAMAKDISLADRFVHLEKLNMALWQALQPPSSEAKGNE
jgi:hypothetical protein